MKTHSTFFNDKTLSLIRDNLKTNKAAAEMAAQFIDETNEWMNLSYEELRGLVFSPELKRSWFVLSDGNCPACGKSVPMYNWIYEPFKYPWKMKCPHCSELFPKNDFESYYTSGLDQNGIFRHELADRSLLLNEEGGDFGVDDGNGWYDENGRRYMFIGAYLSHARWRAQVKNGIQHLGFSYILTGNPEYAHKTGVLLDAISRHWPDFDFYTQGIMYEQEYKSNGYVNYWVDSNREVRLFALGYDQVFSELQNDREFEKLIGKSFLDFCADIEDRILLDSLSNMKKIHTNPPETPQTVAIINSVLYGITDEIILYIDEMITEATGVDGLSGESGLGGYAAISPRAVADLMCLFTNTDDNFIKDTLSRHPQLYKTYRFHIDTWYDAKYYPGVGDSSVFALMADKYTALFSAHAPLTSMYHRSREWFALQLADFYNDPDFAKTIYLSNKTTKGVFNYDFYVSSPKILEEKLESIISTHGPELTHFSANYDQWRISVLHSGSGDNKTMVAMPYDSGKNHTHHDALSLHLFAKGINVTPDYGYPPVNYGGWATKEALWYKHPAAHNQVVVDGNRHVNMPPDGDGMFHRYPEHGQNIMFCDGSFVKATYNSAPEYNDIKRNERLAAVVDTVDGDNYILDISRTDGGNVHARFLHGAYSDLTTSGLILTPTGGYYPDDTILRNHKSDTTPDSTWSADWKIYADDSHSPTKKNIHMKYTGLTEGVTVNTCESWVDITRMVQTSNIRTGNKSVWIPTIYETQKGPATQFAGILEVYEEQSGIMSAKQLEKPGTTFTKAIEVIHSGNLTDVIIANDPDDKNVLTLAGHDIETDALLAVVRYDGDKLLKAAVCSGSFIEINGTIYTAKTNNNIEFL